MDQEKLQFPAVPFDEFQPTPYEAWKQEAIDSLKGGDFEKKLTTKTYEGITLQPIYTQEDVDRANAASTLPGYQNYLRGTQADGYIQEPWAIAQAVSAADYKEANRQIKEDLAKGATAINLAIGCHDLPIADAGEMKGLLEGIDLAKVTLQVYCGATAVETLAWMHEVKTCFPQAQGCVGADPVGVLAKRGVLSGALEEYYDDMAKAAKFATEKAPGLRTILVDGNVYANGGASAVQEVALCLSTAACYIEAMTQRGLSVEEAAGAIRFSFSLGANFFMEIAKLRAARVVYAQMVAAFGGSAEAQKLSLFARTSSFTKTIYDPYVNILRTTTEAFAGAVGGVDAMEVAPLDEPYAFSEELARRIARNQQIMMQEEFGLLQPVDPAGGSWYIETLTAQLAESIWAKFQAIEGEGGVVEALRAGTVQAEIEAVLNARFANLASRSDRAVGVNMYANTLEKLPNRPRKEFRACCGGSAVERVRAITPRRWTEQFEELRDATEAYEAKTGKTVKVFLANMGPIPQHKARADFSCGFFEVAHFEMLRNDGFPTVEAAAEAAIASGADVTVICSTDDTYPELVPPLAKAIKASCPDMKVVLAGMPAKEFKDSYVQAGVDEFIHVRANCYELLKGIQQERGIR